MVKYSQYGCTQPEGFLGSSSDGRNARTGNHSRVGSRLGFYLNQKKQTNRKISDSIKKKNTFFILKATLNFIYFNIITPEIKTLIINNSSRFVAKCDA